MYESREDVVVIGAVGIGFGLNAKNGVWLVWIRRMPNMYIRVQAYTSTSYNNDSMDKNQN